MPACSAVLLVLSLFSASPAPAEIVPDRMGVYFDTFKIGGGKIWLAFGSKDFAFVITKSIFGCAETGGGIAVGYAKNYNVQDHPFNEPVQFFCQGGAPGGKPEFTPTFTHDPQTDTIDWAGFDLLTFRRVEGDPDMFVDGVAQFKTMSIEGHILVDMMLQGLPDVPGADCTDPPNLVPGAQLANCDLRGVEFGFIDLTNANLTNANLSGVDLSRPNLTGANLTGADLSGARIVVLEGIDMPGANLSGADLNRASVRGTNLTGANLTNANLFSADVRWVDLSYADLQSAFIVGADLSHTNLFRANLLGATLSIGGSPGTPNPGDVYWLFATCPDGTSVENPNDGCADFP